MPATERTTKEVVDDARLNLRELVEAHIALAKAELAQQQKELAAGIVPLVLAGVLTLYVLGFYAVTAVKVLDNYVTEGWAWFIVSVAITLIVIVLGLIGRSRLEAMQGTPKQTQESIQETVSWAKAKAGKDS